MSQILTVTAMTMEIQWKSLACLITSQLKSEINTKRIVTDNDIILESESLATAVKMSLLLSETCTNFSGKNLTFEGISHGGK